MQIVGDENINIVVAHIKASDAPLITYLLKTSTTIMKRKGEGLPRWRPLEEVILPLKQPPMIMEKFADDKQPLIQLLHFRAFLHFSPRPWPQGSHLESPNPLCPRLFSMSRLMTTFFLLPFLIIYELIGYEGHIEDLPIASKG